MTVADYNERIDKIKAEIADLADVDAYGDYQQGFNFGLMRAAQILDKHKIENETQEMIREEDEPISNFDVHKFIGRYYEPVEDKPGYVWFNKRNMRIISMDILVACLKNYESVAESEE